MKTLIKVQNIYDINVNWQANIINIIYQILTNYKTENISINGETTTINFSDLHNNYKYIYQVFQAIDSLFI